MTIPKFGSSLRLTAAVLVVLLLPACSINVKKDGEGQDKKVDIETPIGGIHVSKNADVRDLGLPVYPGAREKPKDESGEEKSANVNISGPGFGLKVVAIEYLTNDPPDKVVSYYKDQLKKYGNVLECHTSKHGHDTQVDAGKHGDRGKELSCDTHDNGKTVELKVGSKDDQHIVAVEPDGKGSSFALVYVAAHDKRETI